MKMWIARDSGITADLYLYENKPYLNDGFWDADGQFYNIDIDLFPEVTFENSPMEVELVLKK